MAEYCGVQTCNNKATGMITISETLHGVELRGESPVCNKHYDAALPATNMAWPKQGSHHSFPIPESTSDMWGWRLRIGETPEQGRARMEQEKAAAAYRLTEEFRLRRAEALDRIPLPSLGPLPTGECDVWEAGKEHDVVISFVQADMFQEDILDSLAMHGNYVRVVHTLEEIR